MSNSIYDYISNIWYNGDEFDTDEFLNIVLSNWHSDFLVKNQELQNMKLQGKNSLLSYSNETTFQYDPDLERLNIVKIESDKKLIDKYLIDLKKQDKDLYFGAICYMLINGIAYNLYPTISFQNANIDKEYKRFINERTGIIKMEFDKLCTILKKWKGKVDDRFYNINSYIYGTEKTLKNNRGSFVGITDNQFTKAHECVLIIRQYFRNMFRLTYKDCETILRNAGIENIPTSKYYNTHLIRTIDFHLSQLVDFENYTFKDNLLKD